MRIFLLLLFLLTVRSVFGQRLISPSIQYEADISGNQFNEQMMNILFANKVGTAFQGTNDLSLQKFFASLDADDKSLSIGSNFDTRGVEELEKLTFVFSAGVKIKAKNKFATIYKNGDFQEDNIGAALKISWIGNGIIDFTDSETKNRDEALTAYRQFLYSKYDTITANFNRNELTAFENKISTMAAFDGDLTSVDEELTKKRNELYIAMAKEEIEYLEKNKMYRYLWDHWVSLDVFVPLGENNYKTTNDIAGTALTEKTFYAFSATLSYNNMLQFSSGESIFLKLQGILKNNNNIIVDDITSQTFQTTTPGAGGTTVITESNDGYVANFQQFLTPTFIVEPSVFFFNNTVGLSPSIEFNTGKYNKTNWKLGIPVSLKDKDGKPKVNFELQWKEVNTFTTSVHLVGVSANFLFGDLIN